MARDTRTTILDAALEVFAEKGFDKATNKDIAQVAGINSPGLIYHYFTDKLHLLREVMVRQIPFAMEGDRPWQEMELEEGLNLFALRFLKFGENPVLERVARIAIGQALARPGFAETAFTKGPAHLLEQLTGFFQKQIEDGKLSRQDPSMLAHIFMGPLVKALMQRVIFRNPEPHGIEDLAQAQVRIFLNGCRGEQAA